MNGKWYFLIVASSTVAAISYCAGSERATLETVRELVARNEALIDPISMEYTVKLSRTGERPEPAGGPRLGRRYSHSDCAWAQAGEKHYARVDCFYGPNEPAGSTVYVFDSQITATGKLPELMQGTIRSGDVFDWYNAQVTKLGLRPFEGRYRLSRLLVPEHAFLNRQVEVINGRETYVVDAKQPAIHAYFARIWIDRQCGMPLRIWYFDKHPNWPDARLMSEIKDIELHRLPNGGWIPVRGVRSINFSDDYVSYEHMTVDVNSIAVGRDDVPGSLFELNFPEGAGIFNAISGLTFVQGKPKKSYEQIVRNGGMFIAGVVVDHNGLPVRDVVVRVNYVRTPGNDGRSGLRLLAAQDRPCAITDAQGRFALEPGGDGVYDLRFLAGNHADSIAYDIPVGKKDLKVTLEEGGTVTGGAIRIENGRKVPFADVEVKAEQDTRSIFAQLGADRDRKTVTDSRGRFVFEHLRTRMRDFKTGTAEQPRYVPRPWTISCGQESRTVEFHDADSTQEVELVLQPALSEILPLVGKPLPELAPIEIDFASEKAKDMRMLLCFFDMSQRPSRRCILQLSTRAQEFEAKDVVVAAIQASKVDQDTLNEWLKKYDIRVPVGMIQGDEKEIRFSWGVKSLPWLILTDRNHTVLAEGFGHSELYQKIKEAGDAEP
jgi:hypothetical protein